MNRDQVIQQLYRLYQNGNIFDTKIRVAINLAILELSGGKAEIPPKVKAVLDKMRADTNRLIQLGGGQRVLKVDEEGRRSE